MVLSHFDRHDNVAKAALVTISAPHEKREKKSQEAKAAEDRAKAEEARRKAAEAESKKGPVIEVVTDEEALKIIKENETKEAK